MSVLSESVPVLQQTTRGAKLGPVSSLTAMAGAPPSQAQSSGRERSWRRRVPTALLVTLLGIGLTAWILPAFTRQWDDRQKAHELKAAIVAESASATANVLTAAQRDVFTLTQDPRRSLRLTWVHQICFSVGGQLRAFSWKRSFALTFQSVCKIFGVPTVRSLITLWRDCTAIVKD
jgi:hypothetical protein